jgi:nucleoside phosphorylase
VAPVTRIFINSYPVKIKTIAKFLYKRFVEEASGKINMKDKIHFDKLLVVALQPEWSFLKAKHSFELCSPGIALYRLRDKSDVGLAQIGFGPESARRNFSHVLTACDVTQVLHFGSCGALHPEMKISDLFAPEKIVSAEGAVSLSQAGQNGVLFTSSSVLKNRDEKDSARKTHNADCVDMESYPVAKQCLERGIFYHCVRAVFDTLTDNLEAMGEPYDADGNIQPSKMAVNLIKNPKLILELPDLKRRSDLVSQSLAPVVAAFL